MNSKYCNCDHTIQPLPTDESKQDKKQLRQGFTAYVKMAIPVFAFVIIPKCPVCLAGYIALLSGVSLSITTAGYLRIGLIIVCILSLTYFIIRHVKRFVVNNH